AVGGAVAAAATQVVQTSSAVDFDIEAPAASSGSAAEPSLEFDLDSLNEKTGGDKASASDLGGSIQFDGGGGDNVVDFDITKGAAADAPAASGGDEDIKWEVDAPAAPEQAADAGPGSGN